jgi:transposase
MIAEHIKVAVLALLAADAGATDVERERVKLALTGTRPNGAIIRTAKAAEMLGVHSHTIHNWVKSGKLVAVTGANGKMIGVTEASLAAV